MELCLSLGDGSRTVRFSKESKSADEDQKPSNMSGLDFCMALGLSSPSAAGNQEPEKPQEINGGDDDDDHISEGDDGTGDYQGKNHLQLNLLSLVPVNPHRRIHSRLQSLPWSSDNGSSENGSSWNMGMPAVARGLDVNSMPAAAADEVSTANSVGSPLIHMDFGMYRTNNLQMLSGNKRSSETENDVVEAERTSSRASDDDENGINTRKKLRLSKQQSAFLEESFKEHNTLNPKQKVALAKHLNLRPRQVEVWFQNRRARTKLKQTEVDCEYLKRCCDTLTEENRKLHKELRDLRALKTSNPFYMQPPATTLTMCPSCERVAATSATVTVATAAKTATANSIKAILFPLTRPRYYPFTQTPTHHNNNNNNNNQPAAS